MALQHGREGTTTQPSDEQGAQPWDSLLECVCPSTHDASALTSVAASAEHPRPPLSPSRPTFGDSESSLPDRGRPSSLWIKDGGPSTRQAGRRIDRGAAGYLGPNERIATDRGLLRAQDLADLVIGGDLVFALTHQGPKPVTSASVRFGEPLYRVSTARGFSLAATRNHPLRVYREGHVVDVSLDKTSPWHDLVVLLPEGIETAEVDLDPVRYERSKLASALNTSVLMPLSLGAELVYFLGYAFGNGYVHRDRRGDALVAKGLKLTVPDSYPLIYDRLVSYCYDLFGLRPTIEHADGKCQNVSLYSRLLVEWLDQNGLLKSHAHEIRIPEAIFRSPTSVAGAFVSGYFDSDGSDRHRRGGYGFDSISKGMLKDVQVLLAANGILSTLRVTDPSTEARQTVYRLSVTGAVHKARMSSFLELSLKNKHIPGKHDESVSYSPGLRHNLALPQGYQHLLGAREANVSVLGLNRLRTRLLEDGHEEAASRVDEVLRQVPERVLGIERVGEGLVYGFEVEGTGALSANGLYVSAHLTQSRHQ